jgi:oxazoline/thiazoline synthase
VSAQTDSATADNVAGAGGAPLRLRADIGWRLQSDDAVELRWRGGGMLLRGGHAARLVPLLGTGLGADRIVAAAVAPEHAAEAYHTLLQLETAGYVVAARGGVHAGEEAFWLEVGEGRSGAPPPHRAPPRLHSLLREPPVDPEAVLRVLLGGDLPHSGDDAPDAPAARNAAGGAPAASNDAVAAPFVELVLAADYGDARIAAIESAAAAAGRAVLLVQPTGTTPWLGPLLVPGRSACRACLLHRLGRGEASVAHPEGASAEPVTAETLQMVLAYALVCARMVAAGAASPIPANALLALDLRGGAPRLHRFGARPGCAACAALVRGLAAAPPAPSFKATSVDGGHRVRTAGRFLAQHAHLIDPLTGVLAHLDPLDVPGAPAIRACWGMLRRWGAPTGDAAAYAAFGKGFTDEQARASCLGEAIERHALLHAGGDRAVTYATQRELGDRAIAPNDVLLLGARQLAESAMSPFFDADAVQPWCAVAPLDVGPSRFVPAGCVLPDFPLPAGAVTDSNGCAAGSTHDEAVLQAMFELIERDAVALWWYNRVGRPAVRLDGWPWRAELDRAFGALGMRWWLLDLTTDLGVTVFAAVATPAGGAFAGRALLGFGAHLDPLVAAGRAAAELGQVAAMLLAPGLPDGADRGMVAVPYLPYLEPARSDPIDLLALPDRSAHDDLLDDVRTCTAALAERGLMPFVYDLTRADVGVPTVRVIVPGLRPMLPRHAPGRLYDVPVLVGWLPRPRTEAELNPVALKL